MATIAELLADKNNNDSSDRRKHRELMTKAELKYLRERIDGIEEFRYMRYSQRRLEQASWRGYTNMHVLQTIKCGKIVEAHIVGDDPRVLLRWSPIPNAKDLCVVVSLRTRQIITIYFNKHEDNHRTLKWSEYSWHGSVIKEFDRLSQV